MKTTLTQIVLSASLPFILIAAMYVNDSKANTGAGRSPAVEKTSTSLKSNVHKYLLTVSK